MKLVKIGLCSLGLVGAVVSVNAAPQSPDQALSQCQATYQKMIKQSQADKPQIQKAIMTAFKENAKDKEKLKAQITQIASKYVKGEFAIMQNSNALNSCSIAAKAGKQPAYVPLMTAYMANGDATNAQSWCNKAAAAKLNNASYIVYSAAMLLLIEAHLMDILTGLGWTIYPPLSTAGALLVCYGVTLAFVALTVMGFRTTFTAANYLSTMIIRSSSC